jgi:hypothetical protein
MLAADDRPTALPHGRRLSGAEPPMRRLGEMPGATQTPIGAPAAHALTLLAFEGGPRLDLRWRLSRDERRALAELELGPTFAVLTTESPGGATGDELSPEEADDRARENVRRTLRFEEHLARGGVPYRRVEAIALDGSHRERWVAVALGRDDAERLAREHAQAELLWYDGERFWPWHARAEEEPLPVPPP